MALTEDGIKPATGRFRQTGGSCGPGLRNGPAGTLRQCPKTGLEEAPAGAMEYAEVAGLVFQSPVDGLQVAFARELGRFGVRFIWCPRWGKSGPVAERPSQGAQFTSLIATDLFCGTTTATGEPLAPPHQAALVRRGL